MIYEVSGEAPSRIRLNETDTVASVIQNVRMILSTPKGTVPMYRDFGLDMDFLDSPTLAAQMQMRALVRETVEQWEPRARVKDVRFAESARDGMLKPIVEVEINEG